MKEKRKECERTMLLTVLLAPCSKARKKGKGGKNGGSPSPLLWNVFKTLVAAFKIKPGDWKQPKIVKSSFSKHKNWAGNVHWSNPQIHWGQSENMCTLKINNDFWNNFRNYFKTLMSTAQSEQPSNNWNFFRNWPHFIITKNVVFIHLVYQIMVGKPNGTLQKASALERQ